MESAGTPTNAIKEMSMSLMINTNVEAYDAHRNLVSTENALAKSMQRLSSGLRINSAADDAAGLAISQKLTGQVNGLDQAQRNAQDGVSLVQTAEGSLNQVHAMLQRVRELAVQYSERHPARRRPGRDPSEVDQLASEISRIGTTAQFNGIAAVHAAPPRSPSRSAPTTARPSRSRRQSMAAMVSGTISLGTATTLASIDTMIGAVSTQRAQFGAVQNRLQYTLDNLATYQENLTSSLSRIRDVDMASEMVNFTKEQILSASRHLDAGAGQLGPAVSPQAPAVDRLSPGRVALEHRSSATPTRRAKLVRGSAYPRRDHNHPASSLLPSAGAHTLHRGNRTTKDGRPAGARLSLLGVLWLWVTAARRRRAAARARTPPRGSTGA